MPSFESNLSTYDAESVTFRGEDLTTDLMGELDFGGTILLLLAGERPDEGETRLANAVLESLMVHGVTPHAIAARMTYLSEPTSIQGAVASGLLGVGSRFVGSMQERSAVLQEIEAADDPEAAAQEVVASYREAGDPSPASATRSTSRSTRAHSGCSRSPGRRVSPARTSSTWRPSSRPSRTRPASSSSSTSPAPSRPSPRTWACRRSRPAASPSSAGRPASSPRSSRRIRSRRPRHLGPGREPDDLRLTGRRVRPRDQSASQVTRPRRTRCRGRGARDRRCRPRGRGTPPTRRGRKGGHSRRAVGRARAGWSL